MNRSASEWAFQQYLREASALDSSPLPPSSLKPVTADNEVVEIKNNCNTSMAAFAAGPPNVPIDLKEHQAYLRSWLDLVCAAVALTREYSVAARHNNGSQTFQLKSVERDLPKGEDKDVSGGLIPSMQGMQKKSTSGQLLSGQYGAKRGRRTW